MKLTVFLAIIAWSNGAKLDNTYLPPSHAPSSGGSEHFLQTQTGQSSNEYQRNSGFAQHPRGPGRNEVAQNGNEYARDRNGFTRIGNNFAQNGNDYAQDANGFAQTGNFNNGFRGFEAPAPERAQAVFERNAAILRQATQNDGETYSFAYETENGIFAEENGVATNGVEAQGGFSYTGDDGQVYSVRYTADQNGFVPQGDHLPTPPPVPEEILRALEQNARDEAAGIYDDGSYNEAKYNSNNNYDNRNNFNGGNNNYNNGNNYNGNDYKGNNDNDEDTIVTNSAVLHTDKRPGFGKIADHSYNRGFRKQGNRAGNGNQNTGFNRPTFQGQSQSSRNQGNRGSNGATNAYLPPLDNQRSGSNGMNDFGRRQQSFNARNGYQY